MPESISECERIAHAHGLAAGLGAALGGVDADAAPGLIAALPAARVAPGAAVIPHRMAELEGISFVRPLAKAALRAEERTALAGRLGGVRLGMVRSLAERAVGHLSGRVVGGEPTIRKQLVLGSVADLVTETEAIRRLLTVAGTVSTAVADAHERLTVLGWEAAKLFGASGYLVDGPARGVYVSRLVANCWVSTEAGAS
ncbi:MAG TPA: hypothetical protein VFU74_02535 [Actinocrinis sp.]|nr:hypothetical protein [Actinocrinis sp.]